MPNKKILIVNDDGINSPGLLAAKNATQKLGKVTVVAPATQQSGVGRAITLFHPVRVSKVNLPDGSRGFVVAGTPVDCVIIGIYGILKSKPNLVVSGINIGENLSMELTTSGTTAATMEAANQGIPAVAVSLQLNRTTRTKPSKEFDFTIAQDITEKIAKWILKNGLPSGVDLLNINIPHNANNETPITITKLARRMYQAFITKKIDRRGRVYYSIDGNILENDAKPRTDLYAVFKKNAISITPISLDMTARFRVSKLEKLKHELERH